MLKIVNQYSRHRKLLSVYNNLNNNFNIDNSSYYKQLKKTKSIDLTKKDFLYPDKGYIIIDNKQNIESLFIFQDISKTKQSIFVFEGKDDVELFKSLLAAENGVVDTIDYQNVLIEEIIDLCIENNFACRFYSEGSFVTPFNMKI